MISSTWRSIAASVVMCVYVLSPTFASAQATEALVDPFFRQADAGAHEAFAGLPGETIDLFSGTLHLAQVDIALPGKAGLDVRVQRTYTSKLSLRSDDTSQSLAEDEHSVLGYGWSLHMGRLRNPTATGTATTPCLNSFPVLELPDGTSRTFYQSGVDGGTGTINYVSRDHWVMQTNCASAGAGGVCIWSTDGVRYDFSSANEFRLDATAAVWPASAITDRFSNSIRMEYVSGSAGALTTITDTYGRVLSFQYTQDVDGLRLASVKAGAVTYAYSYSSLLTSAGPRRFLSATVPPVGPGYAYQYDPGAQGAANPYALTAMTTPNGGTVSYAYVLSSFYVGTPQLVPMATVARRALTDRGGKALGAWNFAYNSPTSGMSTTTVQRPDATADVVTLYGFGAVASGSVWRVGLTQQVSRGNGAEVEARSWGPGPAVSASVLSAPAYSTTCATEAPASDAGIFPPRIVQRDITRDGSTYRTTYSNFDSYGRPGTVAETGQQARTTTWTYFAATSEAGQPTNLVGSLPLTQHVCVGSDCFDNSWSYGGPHFTLDSRTTTGLRTSFAYDTFGNVASVTDPAGVVTQYAGYVEGNGTPTAVTYNGAVSVSRVCSWEGRIVSETNPRDFTTSYSYDDAGRLAGITPPGNSYPTAMTYAPDYSYVKTTRGAYVSTQTLDGFGRAVATTDSEGSMSRTDYDVMGRVSFRSYAYGATSTVLGDKFSYDSLGRVLEEVHGYNPSTDTCDAPGGCRVTNSYAENCVTTQTERATNDTVSSTKCYDSFGTPAEQRLESIKDGAGYTWAYSYNAFGGTIATTAPLASGNTSATFDPVTQLQTSYTTGPSGTVSVTRDAAGRVSTKSDARGVTATYSRNDPLQRITGITYAGGPRTGDDAAFGYDAAGNLTNYSSDNSGSVAIGYDELNRPVTKSWRLAYSTFDAWVNTKYVYDAAGCLTSITYPSGAVAAQTCDTANRVVSISLNGEPIVTSVTYHPSGRVASINFGNGRSVVRKFDARNRVVELVSPPAYDSLVYSYDGANNVVSYDEVGRPSAPTRLTETFTYDKLNRLITAIAPNAWGTAAYDYDAVGHRTMNSTGSYTINYVYDAVTGRLASSTGGSAPPVELLLEWDSLGNLLLSSSEYGPVSYYSDPLGRRVERYFGSDGNGRLFYNYSPDGRVLSESLNGPDKLRDYFYVGDIMVAVDGCITAAVPACTQRAWYHLDLKSNVLARSNASGTAEAFVVYDPWGEIWSSFDTVADPDSSEDRHFLGGPRDRTGLYDRNGSVYAPVLGRVVNGGTFSYHATRLGARLQGPSRGLSTNLRLLNGGSSHLGFDIKPGWRADGSFTWGGITKSTSDGMYSTSITVGTYAGASVDVTYGSLGVGELSIGARNLGVGLQLDSSFTVVGITAHVGPSWSYSPVNFSSTLPSGYSTPSPFSAPPAPANSCPAPPSVPYDSAPAFTPVQGPATPEASDSITSFGGGSGGGEGGGLGGGGDPAETRTDGK